MINQGQIQRKDASSNRSWYPVCASESEKGVVLVVVLILAAVSLTLMTALIYMITTGTQVSGFQKKYKTALEAGQGGADIFLQVIGLRGETAGQNAFLAAVNTYGLNAAVISNPTATCTATVDTATYTGFQAKLMAPSDTWAGCNRDVAIIPSDINTYDMQIDLGTTAKYRVYAKITGASKGNSSGDESLMTQGVVSSNAGEVAVMSRPYLYSIEIDSENAANPQERAKLSVLYQY
jgi:hypothetical protein